MVKIYCDISANIEQGTVCWAFLVYHPNQNKPEVHSGASHGNITVCGEATTIVRALQYSRKILGPITIYTDDASIPKAVARYRQMHKGPHGYQNSKIPWFELFSLLDERPGEITVEYVPRDENLAHNAAYKLQVKLKKNPSIVKTLPFVQHILPGALPKGPLKPPKNSPLKIHCATCGDDALGIVAWAWYFSGAGKGKPFILFGLRRGSIRSNGDIVTIAQALRLCQGKPGETRIYTHQTLILDVLQRSLRSKECYTRFCGKPEPWKMLFQAESAVRNRVKIIAIARQNNKARPFAYALLEQFRNKLIPPPIPLPPRPKATEKHHLSPILMRLYFCCS